MLITTMALLLHFHRFLGWNLQIYLCSGFQLILYTYKIQATCAISNSVVSKTPLMSNWSLTPKRLSLYIIVFQPCLCQTRLWRKLGCVEMIIRSPQKKNISFTLPVSNFRSQKSVFDIYTQPFITGIVKIVLKSCVRSGNICLKSLSMW